MGLLIALIVLILVALAIAVSCIKIVPQANAIVVERLGGYLTTWSVGLHFKAPFIDRVAKKVLLKEQVVDFPPQPVITKDNVTMQIDTVVYFQITDPKLYAYGVENPIMAIENLTATTLRNIIGDLELDETLTSRETINTKMRSSLDVATDPWGIKVNRVELKNIIPPANAIVVERLGGYLTTWSVGLHFKAPFIDRVAKKVLLKEQVVDFPPQPVITKDNVTMQIDTVVYFQITDPKLYAYGVENPIMAIENLTATTLRNIIGDLELDETLTSRETINTKMRSSLDVATDPWGIKVNRVELKNIIPPAAIQDAMEKQMKAERERREAILRAEGEKKSTVLVAEGKKESAILDAEAEKQAAILRAEAHKEATIREAEGQAEAILKIQQANADGLRMLKEAAPDAGVLQLKSLEAFAKAADGKATKIIIPSEIQGIAGLAKSVVEVGKEN